MVKGKSNLMSCNHSCTVIAGAVCQSQQIQYCLSIEKKGKDHLLVAPESFPTQLT
jgi:hypothetical protein